MDRKKVEAMTDERALVRRIQNGDASAFEELVEGYKQQVYYLALDLSGNHHDAEDLSQEVFIKAYRGLGRFRSGAKISSWLHRITVNAYIDSQRKKAHKMVTLVDRKDEHDFDPLEKAADEVTGNPERAAASVGIGEHVEEALHRLSEQERAVFVMRHYHDMRLKEISKSLAVAEGTVKSLLFRSIRKLRDHLDFYKDELGLEDPAK
jgi:RNA polymerase sigma-70 factor (ECF subfamily)